MELDCSKCGRKLTAAELTIAGATFSCQACLGCNHLFIPLDSARISAKDGPKLLPAKSSAPPACESCPLTPEEEAVVRKLLSV